MQDTPPPDQHLSAFVAERIEALGHNRRTQASTWKMACSRWLEEIGPQWPTPANMRRFAKHCRDRVNATYAAAHIRVIEAWRDALAESGQWVHVEGQELPTSPQPPEARTASSEIPTAQGIAEAVFQRIFGGEAAEDYWATIMRHVSTRVGVDGIAAMLKLDRDTAERFVVNRRIPRHARAAFESLHAMLVLRRAEGFDVDELGDRMIELEAYDRGGMA